MRKVKRAELSAPQGLIEHAHQRTTSLTAKVRKAISAIESDIEQNDGLYPFNKGRVTQAEVARRAGIRNTSLQGPAHKDSTRVEVNTFLIRLSVLLVKGRKSIRKTVTERADTWKEQLRNIGDRYHLAELELIDARLRIQELTDQNTLLLKQLERGARRTVTALPKKGK